MPRLSAQSMQRLENRLFTLECKQRASQVEARNQAIKARLCDAPISEGYHPSFFVRPEKYKVPTLGQWKRWLKTRIGIISEEPVKVLCISCGMPLLVSEADKSYWGTGGKKTIQASPLTKVTVGAVVKWTEEVVTIHNTYDADHPYLVLNEQVDVERERVFRVVTHTALGCLACQLHMRELEAEAARVYEHNQAVFEAKWITYKAKVDQYVRQNPSLTEKEVHTLYHPQLDVPVLRSAYILVDPKTIQPEQTVEYWRHA